jgi:hypothetical protein
MKAEEEAIVEETQERPCHAVTIQRVRSLSSGRVCLADELRVLLEIAGSPRRSGNADTNRAC